MGENWILMKFEILDILQSFFGRAPAVVGRLSSRAGAAKKSIRTKGLTKFHVNPWSMAVGEVELVSPPGGATLHEISEMTCRAA